MTPNDISTPKKAEDATRHPLALLDALLWQMNRDRPSTGDLLPNRAGEERRAKAELIQGYIDALEPIVAALRAQAEAEAEAGLTAEVWVHGGAEAELIAVTGRVHWQTWQDLTEDVVGNNHPDLPEGAYLVPVERDNTTPTGEASGTYTHYLDWSRAALAQAGSAAAPEPQVCKFHGKSYCGPEDGFSCMSPACFAVPAQAGGES